MIHWSLHKDHLVVYHGTHVKNVPAILKNGINNKDPKTGMVSVAIGSHGQNIAHGYAAMSGEYGFRQAGQKATTVPHEDRAIVSAKLPMDWVHKNVDRNFGGNPTDIKQRLSDPELHRQHVAKTGSDFSPTETPELRFKEAIPAKYIVDVTQKRKPMKNFREFSESLFKTDHFLRKVDRIGDELEWHYDRGDEQMLHKTIKSSPTQHLQCLHNDNCGYSGQNHPITLAVANELKNRGRLDYDKKEFSEDVPTNAMTASSPSAIANPNNNGLFKKNGQTEIERRRDYFLHKTKKMHRRSADGTT